MPVLYLYPFSFAAMISYGHDRSNDFVHSFVLFKAKLDKRKNTDADAFVTFFEAKFGKRKRSLARMLLSLQGMPRESPVQALTYGVSDLPHETLPPKEVCRAHRVDGPMLCVAALSWQSHRSHLGKRH